MHSDVLIGVVRVPERRVEMHGAVGNEQAQHGNLPAIQRKIERYVRCTIKVGVTPRGEVGVLVAKLDQHVGPQLLCTVYRAAQRVIKALAQCWIIAIGGNEWIEGNRIYEVDFEAVESVVAYQALDEVAHDLARFGAA